MYKKRFLWNWRESQSALVVRLLSELKAMEQSASETVQKNVQKQKSNETVQEELEVQISIG